MNALVAAIREEHDASWNFGEPLKTLARMRSESTPCRNQVLLCLAKSSPHLITTRVPEFGLAFDPGDLSIRKQLLEIAAASGLCGSTLSNNIHNFRFAQQDIAHLTKVAHSLEDANTLSLFIETLRQQPDPIEFPDQVKRDFAIKTAKLKPFDIAFSDRDNKNYGELNAVGMCTRVLGVENIFESSVFPVPPCFQKILAQNPMASDEGQAKLKNWLSFCALALHGKYNPTQEPAVKGFLRFLCNNGNDRLRYNYVQLLSKILSKETTAQLFTRTAPRFADPRLLVMVLGSLTNSDSSQLPDLIERLALAAGQARTASGDQNNFDACLQIAQDQHVSTETKFRLFDLCIARDSTNSTTDVIEDIHRLGRIFDEIAHSSVSSIGQALIQWLPSCKNLEQLRSAAKNDINAVKAITTLLLNNGSYSVERYLDQSKKQKIPRLSKLPLDRVTLTPEQLGDCIAEAREDAMRVGDIKRTLGVMNSILDVKQNLVADCLARVHGRHPIIAENIAEDQSDFDQEPGLINSHHLAEIAAFTLADVSPTDVQTEKIERLLRTIFDLRAPDISRTLLFGLGHVMRHPKYLANLEALLDQHGKPHLQSILLPMAKLAAHDDEVSQTLMREFRKDRFKDPRRLVPALLALNAIAFNAALSDGRRRQLIEMCLSRDGTEGAAEHLMSALSSIQALSQMTTLATDTGTRCSQQLMQAGSIDEIRDTAEQEIRRVFPLTGVEASQLARRLADYMASSRQPAALLTYVASISGGLQGDAYREVLDELTTFVRTAILPTTHEAFRNERYDIDKSAHLAEFAASAPAAFEGWKAETKLPLRDRSTTPTGEVHTADARVSLNALFSDANHVEMGRYPKVREVLQGTISALEALQQSGAAAATDDPDAEQEATLLAILASDDPAEQARLLGQLAKKIEHPLFKRDLRGLKSMVAPPIGQGVPASVSVVDSDDPEDLFLAGTEIVGSCQSIHASADYNKALMGYVLDGKYRLLAVKDDKGRIVARRMMRLMWNSNHPGGPRPVIQLERLYANPGVPQAALDEMLELVDRKANLMGADVLSCEEDLPRQGPEHTLQSKGSKRPFEYVDANGCVESEGDFEVAGARQVIFPARI